MSHQLGRRVMLEQAYRVRSKKRAPKALATPQLPRTAEALYVRALGKLARNIQNAALRAFGARRSDAAGDAARAVDLRALESEIDALVSEAAVTGVVGDAIRSLNQTNVREMSRVLGIAPEVLVPGMGDIMDAWRAENVSLIRSLGDQARERVADFVHTATTEGLRPEDLASALMDELSITASRAELIARDQILKANAQMSHERMRRVGVSRYEWCITPDSRVREGHAALSGQVFSFDDPPVVDPKSGRRANPGGDFRCRCRARPIFDDEDEDV